MRALVQRIAAARVEIDGKVAGSAGCGLLVLLGIRTGDTAAEALWLAEKCLNLRIFEDEQGKMNRSLLDVRGDVLVVSQFTLCGDASHGRRPSFIDAAPPPVAVPLYETFLAALRRSGLRVESGVFGARMEVYLVNSGPVTLLLEREPPAASPAPAGAAGSAAAPCDRCKP